MSWRKYATLDERRELDNQRRREWYWLHRDEINAKRREYAARNRERINAQGRALARSKRRALVLTDEDRVDLSDYINDSTFIMSEMAKEPASATYLDYVNFVKTHDMTNDVNVERSLILARKYLTERNSRHGKLFEDALQKLLLNRFDGTEFKVYRQVLIPNPNDLGRGCKIDFVVTDEDTCKDDLDLTRAVIISCKTAFSTQWREDMHLYDKCKAYIMVTLNGKIPHDQLPDNVFFCKPGMVEFNDHMIDMADFTQTIADLLTDY